jgi:hypothetical protein
MLDLLRAGAAVAAIGLLAAPAASRAVTDTFATICAA